MKGRHTHGTAHVTRCMSKQRAAKDGHGLTLLCWSSAYGLADACTIGSGYVNYVVASVAGLVRLTLIQPGTGNAGQARRQRETFAAFAYLVRVMRSRSGGWNGCGPIRTLTAIRRSNFAVIVIAARVWSLIVEYRVVQVLLHKLKIRCVGRVLDTRAQNCSRLFHSLGLIQR